MAIVGQKDVTCLTTQPGDLRVSSRQPPQVPNSTAKQVSGDAVFTGDQASYLEVPLPAFMQEHEARALCPGALPSALETTTGTKGHLYDILAMDSPLLADDPLSRQLLDPLGQSCEVNQVSNKVEPTKEVEEASSPNPRYGDKASISQIPSVDTSPSGDSTPAVTPSLQDPGSGGKEEVPLAGPSPSGKTETAVKAEIISQALSAPGRKRPRNGASSGEGYRERWIKGMPRKTAKTWLSDVCAICEQEHAVTGQDVLVCMGPCLRGFHPSCLGLMEQVSKEDWFCPECSSGIMRCFLCGNFGAGYEDPFVRKCSLGVCGRFYHLKCVESLSLTSMAVKGQHFRCPQHYCDVCKKSGDGVDMVKCIRCPTAYHSSCTPRDVRRMKNANKAIVCNKHHGMPPPTYLLPPPPNVEVLRRAQSQASAEGLGPPAIKKAKGGRDKRPLLEGSAEVQANASPRKGAMAFTAPTPVASYRPSTAYPPPSQGTRLNQPQMMMRPEGYLKPERGRGMVQDMSGLDGYYQNVSTRHNQVVHDMGPRGSYLGPHSYMTHDYHQSEGAYVHNPYNSSAMALDPHGLPLSSSGAPTQGTHPGLYFMDPMQSAMTPDMSQLISVHSDPHLQLHTVPSLSSTMRPPAVSQMMVMQGQQRPQGSHMPTPFAQHSPGFIMADRGCSSYCYQKDPEAYFNKTQDFSGGMAPTCNTQLQGDFPVLGPIKMDSTAYTLMNNHAAYLSSPQMTTSTDLSSDSVALNQVGAPTPDNSFNQVGPQTAETLFQSHGGPMRSARCLAFHQQQIGGAMVLDPLGGSAASLKKRNYSTMEGGVGFPSALPAGRVSSSLLLDPLGSFDLGQPSHSLNGFDDDMYFLQGGGDIHGTAY